MTNTNKPLERRRAPAKPDLGKLYKPLGIQAIAAAALCQTSGAPTLRKTGFEQPSG